MPYNNSDAIPRTDISTALMEAMGQEGLYIAPQLMPVYDSETENGRYPKFTRDDTALLKASGDYGGAAATLRAPNGTYNESESNFIWDNFQTSEYGEERRIDDALRIRYRNFFDYDMIESKILMNRMMTAYEIQTAAILNNSSTFTATAASVAYTEANIATIDFPKDATDCIERLTLIGEQVNLTAVMSLSLWNRIKRTTKMNTYLFGPLNTNAGGSNITTEAVAAALGLSQIIIAKKAVDTGVKGKAATMSSVWGNSYIWIGSIGQGEFSNGGVGRTIVFSADSPGGLFTSEQYRNEAARGDKIRVRSNRVLKVCNASAAQLITTSFA